VQFERIDISVIGAYPHLKALRDRLLREDCYITGAPLSLRHRLVDRDACSWDKERPEGLPKVIY
jgi:hypothetical protein